MDREAFRSALGKGFRGEVKEDFPLAGFTTFRIGGPADLLAIPRGIEDVMRLAKAAAESESPLLVLGKGSNVLISDRGFRGVVAVLAPGLGRIRRIGECEVEVEAGCDLNRLINWAIERGLGGLEDLSGIPGSVGGAVRMNAGAYGAAIGDRVEEVSLLRVREREARAERVPARDMGFSYRSSAVTNGDLVYKVKLNLYHRDKGEATAHRMEVLNRRRQKQPLNQPSAGSVFRNPEGIAAGVLIDRCGLRGMTEGEAAVSEKHANFIVNLGKARAEDVYRLIRRVKDEVRRREGIELREEVRIIGQMGGGGS